MSEQKKDNLHELADGQTAESKSNTVTPTDKEEALDSITASNAEESEDNALHENNDIPILNYEKMDIDKLTHELQKLLKNYKVSAIKEHVEEIKKEFNQKYTDLIDDKKEIFLEENPDASESDFEYNLPVKQEFDKYYSEYRNKKNAYYKELQNNLNSNLQKRLSIIEDLKILIDDDSEQHIGDALKKLAEIREEWKKAGSIPRDKYNHVWNNFHFHIERFYDQLHLDRESRDMDFKYNLEQKQKIILHAQELLQEEDVIKAYRELRTLHRIWREEIGPVDREIREEIWEKFSDISKQLHEKREQLFENLRKVEKENLLLKVNIISEIDLASKRKLADHSTWQKEVNNVEALRRRFFSIGKVPIENNEEVWTLYKLAIKNFNTHKNEFYKGLKKAQQENYTKKLALLDKALELKDSDDFKNATPVMKQIQDKWKTIGHVPRKHSTQLWDDFRSACNHYFDRLHKFMEVENREETEAFNEKKKYLQEIKDFELSGDHKTDLESIRTFISTWKSLGRVPYNKRFIEGKFNSALDIFFDKLNMSRRETEAVKFNNRIESLLEQNDKRKIQNEFVFVQRKIDEIQSSILQLENNLAYVSNATKDNPLVREVNKNIEKYKDDLKIWEDKLSKLKSLDI